MFIVIIYYMTLALTLANYSYGNLNSWNCQAFFKLLL